MPRASSSSTGIDDDRPGQRPVDDLGVDPLPGRGGEQLGVGQPGNPPAPAGGQHARGGDQRPGAGAATGLVGAGDGGEAAAPQRALHVPERVGTVVVADRAPARAGPGRRDVSGSRQPSRIRHYDAARNTAGAGHRPPDARRAGPRWGTGPM